MTDDELSEAAETQSHSILGRFGSSRDAICFRWRSNSPGNSRKARVALVGEAAHVIPPIGAQGLNMGLRDAADLADLVREAMASAKIPARRRR